MLYRRLLLLALAVTLAACAAGADPTATPQPSATLAPAPTAEVSARLALCNQLRGGMEQVLKVETRPAEVEFVDYISGQTLQGCQVEATGNGREFSDFTTVAQGLRQMFFSEGWSEDQQYIADGPTGTSSAYRKDAGFCIAQVEWEPAESARCPADQPIGACNLAPEQQLYTITVSCAE